MGQVKVKKKSAPRARKRGAVKYFKQYTDKGWSGGCAVVKRQDWNHPHVNKKS